MFVWRVVEDYKWLNKTYNPYLGVETLAAEKYLKFFYLFII